MKGSFHLVLPLIVVMKLASMVSERHKGGGEKIVVRGPRFAVRKA